MMDSDACATDELVRQGAKLDHSLVWVNKPAKFGQASMYAGYGNEPSVEILYVAIALIVEVPAFGTTGRKGSFP